MRKPFIGILFLVAVIPLAAIAETAYVTDECEIMLRRGQGNSFGILRQLKSGTALQVLERSDDGYSRVVTDSGVNGWVLSRFLTSTPVARDQYARLQQEYTALKNQFDERLEQRSKALRVEIENLKKIAKRPLDLQRENADLKQKLAQQVEKAERIERENEYYKTPYKDRQWFVLGVSTAVGSLLLGMILTRIPWRRKKRWGDL